MTPGTTAAVGATIWLKLVKSTIFLSDPIVCYTV